MTHFNEVEREWEVRCDSPFSLAAEDLCRYYFFNFWMNTGRIPGFDGIHEEIHKTDWFQSAGHHCPGREVVRKIYDQCLKELC